MTTDHFSWTAAQYAACRPVYPAALFGYLASLCTSRRRAWDVGTGSGQAATALADHFDVVIASDRSARQLTHAQPHPKVVYLNAAADASALAPGSIDLICAAQAAHWFDLDRFYGEVMRVASPEGIVALWTYMRPSVGEPIDRLIDEFWFETVGPYWPPERRFVDEAYRALPFPFRDLETPAFALEQQWNVEQFLGYIGTWSSVGRYRVQRGSDPVQTIAEPLRGLWGRPGAVRNVSWPVAMRAACVHQ